MRVGSGPSIRAGRASPSRTTSRIRPEWFFLSPAMSSSNLLNASSSYPVGRPREPSTAACLSAVASSSRPASRASSATKHIPTLIAAPCRQRYCSRRATAGPGGPPARPAHRCVSVAPGVVGSARQSGELADEAHPHADRGAVPPAVLLPAFDGVPEGVPVVEVLARPGLLEVLRHQVGLDLHAPT